MIMLQSVFVVILEICTACLLCLLCVGVLARSNKDVCVCILYLLGVCRGINTNSSVLFCVRAGSLARLSQPSQSPLVQSNSSTIG